MCLSVIARRTESVHLSVLYGVEWWLSGSHQGNTVTEKPRERSLADDDMKLHAKACRQRVASRCTKTGQLHTPLTPLSRVFEQRRTHTCSCCGLIVARLSLGLCVLAQCPVVLKLASACRKPPTHLCRSNNTTTVLGLPLSCGRNAHEPAQDEEGYLLG